MGKYFRGKGYERLGNTEKPTSGILVKSFPEQLCHLLNKYLLNVCCVSGPAETEMNQIKIPYSQEVRSLTEVKVVMSTNHDRRVGYVFL